MDQINLEGSINDVVDMATVSDHLMEDFLKELTDFADLSQEGVSAKRTLEHVEQWRTMASFAVLQTKLMALALRKQFYAKTEEG
jgi:hypothetical protein